MLIAEGETHHLVTDDKKKVRVLPEIYRKLLTGEGLGEPVPADMPPG